MGRKKINILKDLLNEVPHLLEFSYGDNEYSKWRERVDSTLEILFGKNSRQCNNFLISIRSWKQYATDEERQSEYSRDIRRDKNSLETIIAGLEQEEKVKSAIRFEWILKAISNWVYSKCDVVWKWIKDHKVLSVILTLLLLLVTLLGTNWELVESNWNRFISYIRSLS